MAWYRQKQFRMSPDDEMLICALVIERQEDNHSELLRRLLQEEATRRNITIEDATLIVANNPAPKAKRVKDGRPRMKRDTRRHALSSEGLPALKRKAMNDDA